MAVLAVDKGVTYGAWLRRTSRTDSEYADRRQTYVDESGARTPEEAAGALQLTGFVVYVSTQLEGFKRRNVQLRWSLYDAQRARRLPSLSDRRAAGLRLEAPTDRTVQEVFVPDPLGDGPYLVRLQLYDSDGALLAIADSDPIRREANG
jgi:hypothetical protein